MKKIIWLCLTLMIISGCSGKSLDLDENQIKQLDSLGLIDDAKSCDNLNALRYGISEDLTKDKLDNICNISTEIKTYDGIITLANADLSTKEMVEYLSVPFYHGDLAKRYVSFKSNKHTIEDTIMLVNMNLDKPYFQDVETISDLSDVTMLVNKYYKLPDNYVPDGLVEAPFSCKVGEQYSCQTDQPIMLKEEVASHLTDLAQDMKKQGSDLYVIAGYRSYQYQSSLYNYNLNASGQEYADAYYARPGQSEHNSALAVDITLDNINFNEVETSKNYTWLLEHMADYGFILRYPEDKVDLTGYGYESWHLRYVGIDLAKELYQSGLTLDEYYGRK